MPITREQQIERDIWRYSILLEKADNIFKSEYKSILDRLHQELQTLKAGN
jgi:hypothetical protein